MKLLILGASGRTGRLLVKEALNRGYTVHALVRDPAKLPEVNEKLFLFTGSPLKKQELEAAMRGCNVVINCLNISRKSDNPWSKVISPSRLMSQSISHVLNLAPLEKELRLIAITAFGVGNTREYLPWFLKWILLKSNIGVAYADHERQEMIIRKSQTKWTIVRPAGLTNKEVNKKVVESYNNTPKPSPGISRQNLARYLIQAIGNDTLIGKAPTLSEK